MSENFTDQQRDRLMAVFSVAEQMVAVSPFQDYDSITVRHDKVRVMLHHRPEGVAAWAALHGLALTLDAEHYEGRPYLEASGDVSGVPVEVWALGSAEELERYTACLPSGDAVLVGMPAAWHAVGAA